MSVLTQHNGMPLYRQVADELEASIGSGVFEPGERLPSIRSLSKQFGVSVNTVREAYAYLESKRIVGARSQSGHYVLYVPTGDPDHDADGHGAQPPQAVTIDDLAYEIGGATRTAARPQLSVSDPAPHALPVRQLSALAARVARERPGATVDYDISPGNYDVRQNISKRLFEAGVRFGPEHIVLTSGCLDAVMLSLIATCRRGDTVLIESPAFYLFFQLMERLGLRAIEIPSSPQDGMNVETVGFALKHYSVAACLTIPNFGNPNGALMPEERKEQLAALLAHHDVALIEDDIYGELHFEPQRPKVLGAYSNSVRWYLCSSFSKTLAPGYRLGWIATNRSDAQDVARLKMTTSLGAPSMSALVIGRFIESGSYDRHLRRLRRRYEANMIRCHDAVRRYFPAGTRVTTPSGGMVLWVQLPGNLDATELYHRAKARGITFAPGPIFSLSGQFTDYLRITGADWSDQIDAALAVLGELAASAPQRDGGSR